MNAKQRKLLLAVADRLDTVDPRNFSMADFGKDALYYAATIPELKKLGFNYAANKADKDGVAKVWYKGKPDLYAAQEFFGLSVFYAQHLFSQDEYDEFGYPHPAMFADDIPDEDKKLVARLKITRGKFTRAYEPPAYSAARIRAFVRNYNNLMKHVA